MSETQRRDDGLLPCPFCSKTAPAIACVTGFHVVSGEKRVIAQVQCVCGARGPMAQDTILLQTAAIDLWNTRATPASCDGAEGTVAWAVSRWNAEVANRPLVNVHRRSFDTTWRQVIRHFGGDDVALCGPPHDELVSS